MDNFGLSPLISPTCFKNIRDISINYFRKLDDTLTKRLFPPPKNTIFKAMYECNGEKSLTF